MTSQSGSGGSATLSGDTDVALSSPALSDLLQYNGTKWVNTPPGIARIAQQILSGSLATVTFASIPGTYSEILVVMWGRGTAAQWFADVNLTFNSDAGSNYIGENLYATQAAATAADAGLGTSGPAGLLPGGSALAGVAGTVKLSIPQYAATAFHKAYTVHCACMQDSVTNNRMRSYASAGGWKSTAAITRVDLTSDATSFATGSVFTLYGIL